MNETEGQLVATILRVCGQWASLPLWGLALWFFFVSVGAHLTAFFPQATGDDGRISPEQGQATPHSSHSSSIFKNPRIGFSMTFFSFVFPNTALVTATFAIAKAFDVRAIKILGCVMTCLLILTWIGVVMGMIRAIHGHVILWPEKGEDREEGGFRNPKESFEEDVVEEAEVDNSQLPDEPSGGSASPVSKEVDSLDRHQSDGTLAGSQRHERQHVDRSGRWKAQDRNRPADENV